jgi:site-specific recombinase XerD
LTQYGRELGDQVAQEKVSASYAQNLVSSINVVLETLREDRAIRVSPSAVIGEQRTNVRDSAPASMDREKVVRTIADLRYQGFDRQAVVLEVARDLGLRAKEAVMIDYRSAIREAGKTGFVDVREGTKGGRGREVERLVPVSERAMQTLQRGAALQAEYGSRNLIASGENWKSVTDALRTEPVREIMQDHNMKMYHDARVAYACDRYQQITRHPAPAVAGHREADKPADRLARQVIGGELGHGRPDVLVSYVGSAR